MPASLDAVPAAVEAELRTFFDTAVPAATEIAPVVGAAAGLVREFVLQGGKRIRPVFAFAGWRCGMTESARPDESAADGSGLDDPTVGRDASDALRVGAALELVQACLLYTSDAADE